MTKVMERIEAKCALAKKVIDNCVFAPHDNKDMKVEQTLEEMALSGKINPPQFQHIFDDSHGMVQEVKKIYYDLTDRKGIVNMELQRQEEENGE